jgi:hypothetical protein
VGFASGVSGAATIVPEDEFIEVLLSSAPRLSETSYKRAMFVREVDDGEAATTPSGDTPGVTEGWQCGGDGNLCAA